MSPFINPLEDILLNIISHKVEWGRRRDITTMQRKTNKNGDKILRTRKINIASFARVSSAYLLWWKGSI